MKLYAALGASLRFSKGAGVPQIATAWTRALELAESLDDREYQLRALREWWSFHISSGQYPAALVVAQRIYTLAANRSDPDDRLIGEQLIRVSQHYLGDQKSARRHLERVLADDDLRRRHVIRFQVDPQVVARVILARILWLQGFPDQAMRTAESSVEDARTANLGLSVCYGLGTGACVIALLVGDLATAEHYVDMLLDHATRLSLTYWRDYGHCLRGALSIARGQFDAGLQLLRAGFDGRGASRLARQMNTLLVSEALGRAGQTADGLVAIEEAIGRAEHTDERWLLAELLRIKGELLLLESAPGAPTVAEDLFWQALDWARRQGARSWELRTATSLARLFLDQKRSADARSVLQPVYDQFTEAFETADLKAAKALLSTLN